jgi:hypothetical protein
LSDQCKKTDKQTEKSDSSVIDKNDYSFVERLNQAVYEYEEIMNKETK